LRVIRGERLYLRAIERDDLQRCHDWMNDEGLRATLAQRYPMSLAQEADWIERTSRGQDVSRLTFAICLYDGDRHIGNCGLEAIERDNGVATFGILIGETDCRGKGFGEEATRTLCRFAFDEMGLHKIRLDVYAINASAVRTYERVGFRREGVLREEAFRGGRYIDVLRMGLLRGELTRLNGAATRAAPTKSRHKAARRGGARPRPVKR
jgi:RimJ/RimL family protein N-acetyltransferase